MTRRIDLVAVGARRICAAALVLGLLAGGGEAMAHGFNLGFVAPFSGPAAAEGEAARDGLALAASERDSHPEEHSDGHLGGLDSYIFEIDAAAGGLGERVREAVAAHALDIVTFAGPAVQEAELRAILEGTGAVLCPPGAGPVPETLEGLEGARFAAALRAMFGREAGAAAVQGYNAGRAVDRAVRPQDGVADRDALEAICSGGG